MCRGHQRAAGVCAAGLKKTWCPLLCSSSTANISLPPSPPFHQVYRPCAKNMQSCSLLFSVCVGDYLSLIFGLEQKKKVAWKQNKKFGLLSRQNCAQKSLCCWVGMSGRNGMMGRRRRRGRRKREGQLWLIQVAMTKHFLSSRYKNSFFFSPSKSIKFSSVKPFHDVTDTNIDIIRHKTLQIIKKKGGEGGNVSWISRLSDIISHGVWCFSGYVTVLTRARRLGKGVSTATCQSKHANSKAGGERVDGWMDGWMTGGGVAAAWLKNAAASGRLSSSASSSSLHLVHTGCFLPLLPLSLPAVALLCGPLRPLL